MRILIWDMFELRNTGGPSGYLYNIHEYLKDNPCKCIDFLSDIVETRPSQTIVDDNIDHHSENTAKPHLPNRIWHSILKMLDFIPKLKGAITKYIDYTYRLYRIKWDKPDLVNEINSYDYIHFHFLIHVKQFRNTYPDYKGKTIVTSHTPSPWTDELIQADHSLRLLRPIMIRHECKLYNCADYLMFPCIQAKEPYEHNRLIKATLDKLEQRTFYVPTSIIPYNPNCKDIPCRQDYNIPNNAFVIAFFGRHNHVKGYDILKKIAITAMELMPDIYFVCAGNGDIPPIEHPRWKELGFVSNVKDLMQICDLYVLPNRDTYFDLIVIECLRAGLHLAVSDTGGNKYFKTLPEDETAGISFFDIDNPADAVKLIEQKHKLKKENTKLFKQQKQCNKSLFESHFTTEKFIKEYLYSIEQLGTNFI